MNLRGAAAGGIAVALIGGIGLLVWPTADAAIGGGGVPAVVVPELRKPMADSEAPRPKDPGERIMLAPPESPESLKLSELLATPGPGAPARFVPLGEEPWAAASLDHPLTRDDLALLDDVSRFSELSREEIRQLAETPEVMRCLRREIQPLLRQFVLRAATAADARSRLLQRLLAQGAYVEQPTRPVSGDPAEAVYRVGSAYRVVTLRPGIDRGYDQIVAARDAAAAALQEATAAVLSSARQSRSR